MCERNFCPPLLLQNMMHNIQLWFQMWEYEMHILSSISLKLLNMLLYISFLTLFALSSCFSLISQNNASYFVLTAVMSLAYSFFILIMGKLVRFSYAICLNVAVLMLFSSIIPNELGLYEIETLEIAIAFACVFIIFVRYLSGCKVLIDRPSEMTMATSRPRQCPELI